MRSSSSSLSFRRRVLYFFKRSGGSPGAKTFIVKDPDGNLVLFAGPADLSI